MADIYHAYVVLNETLELGLSDEQLRRAEQAFKDTFARKGGFNIQSDDLDNWELYAYLKPRGKRNRQ